MNKAILLLFFIVFFEVSFAQGDSEIVEGESYQEFLEENGETEVNISTETINEKEQLLNSHPYYKHPLKVSLGQRSWEYQEFKNNEVFMQDAGDLMGVDISYENYNSRGFLYKFGGSYYTGSTDYQGGTTNLTTGEQKEFNSPSENRIGEVYFFSGAVFVPNAKLSTSISLGGSVRWLTNPQLDSIREDYTRQSYYATMPIKGDIRYNVTEKLSMGLGLTYYNWLIGMTKSKLSDVSEELPELENMQRKGLGYKAEYDILTRLYNKFALGLKLYYRFWHVEDSDVGTGVSSTGRSYSGIEPESKTKSYGGSITFAF